MLESYVTTIIGEGTLASSLGISQLVLELAIFVGAVIGNFVATIIPFWNKQTEFKEFDISIIFSKKFLGTAFTTFLGSFILISAGFNQILVNVVDQQPVTIFMAFLSAALLGGTSNYFLNKTIKTPNTEQEKVLQQRKEEQIIQKHLARQQQSQPVDTPNTKTVTEETTS